MPIRRGKRACALLEIARFGCKLFVTQGRKTDSRISTPYDLHHRHMLSWHSWEGVRDAVSLVSDLRQAHLLPGRRREPARSVQRLRTEISLTSSTAAAAFSGGHPAATFPAVAHRRHGPACGALRTSRDEKLARCEVLDRRRH